MPRAKFVGSGNDGNGVFDDGGRLRYLDGALFDVTAQRRAEEALQQSQALLMDAIESISEGFSLYDSDDRLVVSNTRYRKLLYPDAEDATDQGTPFETIIRRAAEKGYIEGAEGRVEEWLSERLAQHREPGGPQLQHRADGRWIQVSERKTEDGGTVAVYTDVTELRRAEEELAEKEAQLRLVFDNMPGAIVHTDEELNIVVCNDRFADIYQVPRELLQPGCPYPNFVRYLAEHGYYGEGDVDAFVAERVESLRNPSDKTFETRTPDGHIHQLRRRRAAAGGTVSVIIDITERKRMEKEALAARDSAAEAQALLSDAIENISEGFALYDSDRRLQLCNGKFRDIYNYSEADVAPGTTYEDLVRLDFERGVIADQDGQWQDYVDRRMAYGKEERGSFEVELADGRWVLIHERSTSVGGRVGVQADITELKRAEQELAEKEAQLRVALDNMPGGMVLVDRDANFALVNAQYSELHDYPEGFLKVGMSVREEARFQAERGDYGPGNKDELREQLLDVYQGGKASSWERTLPDGRILRFNMAPTPEGAYATIVTDITEERLAQQARRSAEARFRDAIGIMFDTFAVFDSEGRLVHCNDSFRDIYQYSEADTQPGVATYDSLGEVDAAHGTLGYRPLGFAQRLAEARQAKSAVTTQIIGDRILERRQSATSEGGLISIATDITERKRTEEALRESEERYALAMKGSNDGLWDWDLRKTKIYISPRIRELLGLQSSDLEITSDEWEARIHPDDLEPYHQTWLATLRGETEFYTAEYRARGGDGTYRWVLDRGFGLRDEAGEVYRMAGSLGDITERKRGEQFLRTVVDTLPAALNIRDTECRFVLTNRQLADYYGARTRGHAWQALGRTKFRCRER